MSEMYDIAIIGTGPAGLEAAVTATVRNKKIALFGTKDLTKKLQVVNHPIVNYLGMPNMTGTEMAEVFTRQLESLNIQITEKKVKAVYAMGSSFTLQMEDDTMETAKTVILATGVAAGKPYPGEEKYLGRGVSYCATCDAPLYRGKKVAVISDSPSEESEAQFLDEICAEVLYFPLYKDEPQLTGKIQVIREKPVEILDKGLQTDKNHYDVDGVFILRASQFPGQLVPGLQVDGSTVIVDNQMATNIPGLFAAGDIAGKPYQYIKSAGQGNIAALSAVEYISIQKNKKQKEGK